MKNTLKRLGALLIAAIMMIVMCVPVMARTTETALESDYPTSADSAEVTVSGFEKGQVKEVWAYRIVDAEYDKNGQIGFSGYVAVKDLLREATEQNPKSSDRIPIFGNVSVKDASGNEKYTYTADDNTTVEVYKKADGTYIDGTGAAVTIPSGKTPTLVTEYIAVYPTSSEISLLAEDPSILGQSKEGTDPGTIQLTSTDGGETFKGTVTVGEWLVIAVPADDSETVYNPMLVSAYYVVNNDGAEVVTVDPITANDAWDGKLEVKDAYTKSSRPTVLKEIVDNSRHNPAQDSGNHGDDHAIGDTVDFKITSKIPSYSDEFLKYVQAVNNAEQAGNSYTTENTPIKYEITDTMEKGLTYLPAADAANYKIKVYVGPMNDDGTPMEGTEEYELDEPGAQGYTAKTNPGGQDVLTYTYVKDSNGKVIGYKLAFAQDYVLNNDNKTVTVTYSAKLNDDAATVNYDPNENTVDVTYTIGHEPTEDSQGGFVFKEKTLEDTTYHYTFEIDGDVLGSEEKTKDTDGDGEPDDYEHKTHELLKMDENGNTDVDKTEADKGQGSTETVKISHPLAGAIFSLTRVDAKANGEVYYAMSDTTGHFAASEEKYNNKDINGFKGLDAGVYELEEVKAPSGYSLNKTKYTIIIEAEYYSEDAAADSTNQYKKGMLKDYRIAVLNNSTLKATDTAIIDQIKAGTKKIEDLDQSKVSLTQHTATYTLTKNNNGTPDNTSDDTDETTATVVDKDVTLSDVLQDSTLIKNTKLTDLPSTGGMGSYLFTIIGVAVMAIVAGSYFRSRAKKA